MQKKEVRRRIDTLADELAETYDLQSSWSSENLQITGNGVNGRISVTEDSIEVDLTLGWSLLLLEATIRAAIVEAMDKHFQ